MEIILVTKSFNLIETCLQIFLFPQLIISKFYQFTKRKLSHTTSDFSLIIITFIYILYLLIILNFHLLFLLFFMNSQTNLKKFYIWLILNLVFHLIYKFTSEKKKENFIKDFITNIFLLLIFISSYFTFFITLGSKRNLEIADVRRRKGKIYSLFKFAIFSTGQLISLLILTFLLSLHLLNPISALRIYFELRNSPNQGILKKISKMPISIFKMFTIDLISLILFLFNLVFFLSKIRSLLQVYHKLKNIYRNQSQNNLNNFFSIQIQNELILKTFKKNFLFLINFLLCVMNSIFIWRIRKIKKILFKVSNDYSELTINNFDLIISFQDGLLDITCPFFVIWNHLIFFNFRTIKCFNEWKYFKEAIFSRKNCLYSFYRFHLKLFTSKVLDYILTLFSFIRFLTFDFFPSLYSKENEKFYFEFLFPLLIDDKIIRNLKLKREKNLDVNFDMFVDEIMNEYSQRRKNFFRLIFSKYFENMFIVISLISVLNPFSVFKVIRNFYYFYYFCYFRNSKKKFESQISKNSKISYSHIYKNFLFSQLFQMKCTLYDLVIFFPLAVFACFVSPWNFYYLIIHLVKYSFTIPLNDLRETNPHFKKVKNSNKIISSKNKKFLKKLFTKLKTDWITILKTVLIHLTIFRAILFWHDLMFLFKYKKDRSKNISKFKFTSTGKNAKLKSVKKSLIKKTKEEEKLESDKHLEENEFDLQVFSKSSESMEHVRRLSSKTINFIQESNFKLFTYNLNKHFNQIFMELIFYLPITVILIFTPWNRKHFNTFFKENQFSVKHQIFVSICIKFLTDLITLFSTIFLLLSLVKTIDTIVLLYHAIRKYVFKNKEFERYYNVYYKSDFKGQINEMMRSLISNFIILGLILLNVILITRIPNLIKRIQFYLNTKIMDDLFKFKHLMKIHKNKKFDSNFLPFDDKEICKIAEFLPPQSIINLSLSNSLYLGILNINDVWKNCYENYYKKKLKESNNYEVLDCINTSVFLNFKSLCKEISIHLRNSEKLNENKRDRFLGILQILMEETIESFLNIPHLILIPLKIISYFLLKFRTYLIQKLSYIVNSAYYRKKLKFIYYIFPHDPITKFLDFTIIDSQFYNMQIIGIVCLVDISMILFELLLNSFIFLKIQLINFVCRNELFYEHPQEIKDKLKNTLNKKSITLSIILQLIICSKLLIIHILIVLVSIFFNNNELYIGNNHVKDFNYHEINFTFEPFEILENLWNLFYYSSLQDKLHIIIGDNCTNLIIFYVNYLYIRRIHTILKYSDNFIYDIIFFCFNPNGLLKFLVFNSKYFLLFLLFPQSTLKKIIRTRNLHRNRRNTYSFSDKIFLLFIYLIPFVANFLVRLSISRILLINLYAMVNIIILIYS